MNKKELQDLIYSLEGDIEIEVEHRDYYNNVVKLCKFVKENFGGDPCLICGAPVFGYEPSYCCSGRECACMGLPLEPCICSKKCYDALMAGIGKPMEL